MVRSDPSRPLQRLGRLTLRILLWGTGLALAVAAVFWGTSPALAALGFFAMAFVCWDAGFLLRRVWQLLRTPSVVEQEGADRPSPLDVETELERPPPPPSLWAVCGGAWIELALEPAPNAALAEALDVVVVPLDGRTVVCPAGEQPSIPLEFLGLHAILCRFEDGQVLRAVPRSDGTVR